MKAPIGVAPDRACHPIFSAVSGEHPREEGQPSGRSADDRERQLAVIAAQRAVIDAVDLELLGLLNHRAEAALLIAVAKRALGLPIYDPVREQTILEGVRAANGGPLPAESVSSLFERIIDETRRLERRRRGAEDPGGDPPPEDSPWSL